MDSQTEAKSPSTAPAGVSIPLQAWLHVNRIRLIWGGAIVVAVIVLAIFFIGRQASRETDASKALSDVRLPFNPSVAPEPGAADKLMRVATEYKGTKAAANALHLSAGVLYSEKEYDKARERFNSVIAQYPECLWVPDAHLGVAACLEAQGKGDEAIKKLEDIRKRYATMPIIDDAKLALARLYEGPNPTESFKLYDELLKGNPNSGKAAEAGMRQEELLKKHPDLAKLREPVLPPPQPQITMTTNRPPPGTNRTISLSNIVPRATVTGAAPGKPLEIKLNPNPAPAADAPPAAPAPAPGK